MPIESDEAIKKILQTAETIAIVGASENPERDSHAIMRYLLSEGYKVVPVNPKYESVLGIRSYPNLKSIPEEVDVVDIFRKSEDVLPVVEEALQIGSPTIWMQLGVINVEAAEKAEKSGRKVIMNRCIAIEHSRLMH